MTLTVDIDMPAWLAALLIIVAAYIVVAWTRNDSPTEIEVVLPSDDDLKDSHE